MKDADNSFYICNIRKLEIDNLSQPVRIDFDILLYQKSINETRQYRPIFSYSYVFQNEYSSKENYRILGKLIKNRIFYTRFLRNSKIRLGVSGAFVGLGLTAWFLNFIPIASIVAAVAAPTTMQLLLVPVPLFYNNIINIIVSKKKLTLTNYEFFTKEYEKRCHLMKNLFSISAGVLTGSIHIMIAALSAGIMWLGLMLYVIPVTVGLAAFAIPGMVLAIRAIQRLDSPIGIFKYKQVMSKYNFTIRTYAVSNSIGINAVMLF